MTRRVGKYALLIDAASLQTASRAIGLTIDYKRFLAFFATCGTLTRAHYFIAIAFDDPRRPLFDWLDYNGFTVSATIVKQHLNDGVRRIKRDVSVPLIVNAMEVAKHVDQIVLVTNEDSYRRLVEAVQRMGVFVTVVSTSSTTPPLCGDALRRQASRYLDLQEIRSEIARRA